MYFLRRDVIRSIDGVTATPGNVRDLLIGDDIPGKVVYISATSGSHQVRVNLSNGAVFQCVSAEQAKTMLQHIDITQAPNIFAMPMVQVDVTVRRVAVKDLRDRLLAFALLNTLKVNF
jgi:hypothetical protein